MNTRDCVQLGSDLRGARDDLYLDLVRESPTCAIAWRFDKTSASWFYREVTVTPEQDLREIAGQVGWEPLDQGWVAAGPEAELLGHRLVAARARSRRLGGPGSCLTIVT